MTPSPGSFTPDVMTALGREVAPLVRSLGSWVGSNLHRIPGAQAPGEG